MVNNSVGRTNPVESAHLPPLPAGEGWGEGGLRATSPRRCFYVAQPPSAVFCRRRKFLTALTSAGCLLLGTLIAPGCSSSHPTASLVQSPVYSVPAQQLVTDVQKIISSPPISLPVEDKGNGTLLTGWQEPFRGDFHIVRYWHERTRYRITAVPDFTDPAHRSRLQITDETEERPDEG